MKIQTWIQWSPPSVQQWLKQPVANSLGKHHQKTKTWVTAEILDLCNKRRELRKKRFKLEGSEKYKKVNNNIKPLWNRGKRLLSKIVQENASQKSYRYWTDGQNTALSCTTTRPMEIHQYWTVPRQTQRMATPSFAEKWRLQYNHWRKRSQLESTISQQNWSKQVERM